MATQKSKVRLSGEYQTTLIKSRSKIFKNSPQISVCFKVNSGKDLGIFDYIDFYKSPDLVKGLFGESLKHVPDRNQLNIVSDFVSENLMFKSFTVECEYDETCGMNKIKSISPNQTIPSIKNYFKEVIENKSA